MAKFETSKKFDVRWIKKILQDDGISYGITK